MTTIEQLFATAMQASEEKQQDALKVLKGEAELTTKLTGRKPEPPLLLGMGAAAKYLGVSRPTLWRMIQAGRLEKVELFTGSHRIRRTDLEDLVGRRTDRKD